MAWKANPLISTSE